MSKTIMVTAPVQNVPEYAENKRYIVAMPIDGVLWFYAATNSAEQAAEIESEDPNRVTFERVADER